MRKSRQPPIALKFVPGRESGDCAISILATYLNKSYEDVLRAAMLVEPDYDGKNGLVETGIRATARALGHPLRLKRRTDLEEDFGILVLTDHVVILWNGIVLDSDGTLWEVESYLKTYKYSSWSLLH